MLLIAVPAGAEESISDQPDTTITIRYVGALEAGFTFASTATGSTFEYRLDGAEWKPSTSDATLYFYGAAMYGKHLIEARATDPGGHVDPTPAQQAFSISGVPFRPNEELDPPALSKFKAEGKLLKFSSRGYGRVEFTIEECGWRGLLRSCIPFSTGLRNVDTGRFTVVVAKRFQRGKKYRVHSLAISDTGPFKATRRTVTAK